MARKTNDLDKSSKNEIDSKKIHTKLETKKIPASVKTIIKTAEKNMKKLEKTSKKVSAQSSKAEKNKVKNTRTKISTKRTAKTKPVSIIEHYELPYRYNETIVKILYQTPNTLFVYWDISDKDRKKYLEQYGENFFEVTHPILIVHNDTYNYSFEIPINDFANSWYLRVNDSKCNYRVELGRKPNYIPQPQIKVCDYLIENNLELTNKNIILAARTIPVYNNIKDEEKLLARFQDPFPLYYKCMKDNKKVIFKSDLILARQIA